MWRCDRIGAGVLTGLLVTGLLWVGPAPSAQSQGAVATSLLFDETTKEQRGVQGQASFTFTFAFTNIAPGPVVIESVRTSCGCTVAKVPTMPWSIPPGGNGEFSVALDARGKRGTVSKGVFVNTSIGVKPLTVRAIIEGGQAGAAGAGMEDRQRNMQIALADRFAVFRGECASCHAKPAEGKHGPALYLAACGVCHDSHLRASMVPDLKNLPHATDRDHWIRWITFGRHGSLMPAFSQAEGGPLSEAQIDSLADYLARAISQRRLARTSTKAPTPATRNAFYPPLRPGSVSPGAATPAIRPLRTVTPPPLPVPPASSPAGN